MKTIDQYWNQIKEKKTRSPQEIIKDLQRTSQEFVFTSLENYWGLNPRLNLRKISEDITFVISSCFFEAMQILYWWPEFKKDQENFNTSFALDNLENFFLWNAFHLMAACWWIIFLLRLRYYYLYWKWRKLLKELQDSYPNNIKDVSEETSIEHKKPSVTYNPWKILDL